MMFLFVTLFSVTTAVMAQDKMEMSTFQDEPTATMLRAGNVPMQKRLGDVNIDGKVNISDVTDLINVLLTDQPCQNGDVNLDELINISDVTDLINMLLTQDGGYAVADAQSSLDDIYYSMHIFGWTTTNNPHQCFGITAYNLMAEVMGDDMILSKRGYGWFWQDATYEMKSYYTMTIGRSHDLWTAYYTWIANANYLLATADDLTGTADEKNYVLGQAYAIRAYSYFMLAQSFARTYKGHESDPCVPLFEDTYFTGSTGQPRSTVAQIYAQIDSDINQAITLLTGTTQQSPSHMGYAVVQGLKSRIALVEENWSAAYTAAQKAISFSGKSVQNVSDFMDMNDVSAGNVIWGVDIPDEEPLGYGSLFGHLSTTVEGYGTFGPKVITPWLYNKMSATDTRLAWWDPNSVYSTGGYAQKKFDFADPDAMTGDYIYMRIEEMYLNSAEAACRMGLTQIAQARLMSVMSKRDPNYTCTKTGSELGALTTDSTGSLLEEILIQRRLELWGEDGRIYTIRRLHQGFERNTDNGWPSELCTGHAWNDPECYAWVMTIPQTEFYGNPQMDAIVDQNPLGDYSGEGQHISFADELTTITTANIAKSVKLTLTRAITTGAYQARINRTEGDANFGSSYNVNFADGQASATVNVTVGDMELNHDYYAVYTLSPLDAASGDPNLGEQITSTRIEVHCVNGDPTGQNVSFESEVQQETVESSVVSIPIPLFRVISTGEYRATITLVEGDEHLSLENSAVTFNEGQITANAYLWAENLEKGHSYTCRLRLSDADVATNDPDVGAQITEIVVTITRSSEDWATIGYCTYSSPDFWEDTFSMIVQRDGNTINYRMLNFCDEGYTVYFSIDAGNNVFIASQPSFYHPSYGDVYMRGYVNADESGYAGTYDPNTKTANLKVRYYVPGVGHYGTFDEVLVMP